MTAGTWSDASGLILRLDDYANVYVYSGGVEMGQGHHSALSLGVAECLGVFVHLACPLQVISHVEYKVSDMPTPTMRQAE